MNAKFDPAAAWDEYLIYAKRSMSRAIVTF